MPDSITIIIPTTCERPRLEQLDRAINSILHQSGVEAKVLIIVNGNRFDPAAYDSLRSRSDVVVEDREIGSAPKACEYGRSLIQTTYFGFLDDDDELLPNALSVRLGAFSKNPNADVVVTNGYNHFGETKELRI